jgi:hypothetical protein
MKRPDTRALLAACSFGGLQLALFLALVPLAPSDAHADSASLGEMTRLEPMLTAAALEPVAPGAEAEPAPADEPGTVPADELRDDILVLLAELPTPVAQAAVVTPDVPTVEGVVTDAPVEPQEADLVDAPDMVDLVLPIKAMGGY